jgi:hypothetical protein
MKKVSWRVMIGALGCVMAVNAQEKTAKAPSALELNGSVQVQAQKALWDNKAKVNLDEFWGRANLGATFKTDRFSSVVNIRAFPEGWGYEPLTGLTVRDSTDTISLATSQTQIAKFQIEQAWVKYTWTLLDLRVGRFFTTTSKTFSLGNLLDQNPGTGFQTKLAYHNALEGVLRTGPTATSVLLGAGDKNLNTGYLRIMTTATLLKKALVVKAGYRANVFDRINNKNAVVYDNFILGADYEIIKGVRPYFELGILDNTKGAVQKNIADSTVVPLVIGTTIPAGKLLNALVAEIELLGNRVIAKKDVPILWNLYIDKIFNNYARFQFGLFSDAAGDAGKVRIGLRYTASIN